MSERASASKRTSGKGFYLKLTHFKWRSTVEGRIKCNWTPFQNFGLAQLYVLYALQVFWFSLIVKMAWRMASGKGVVDIRSDSEDSDYDGQQEKSKPIARKKNSKAKSKKS